MGQGDNGTATPGAAAAGEGGGAPRSESRLVQLGQQLLPALVGAIGFVGFVAVAGAAIQWVRFAASQLPADQAVSVIPRPELVAIGANFLILYTLAGVGAVLLVYLLDPHGDAGRETRWGLAVVVGAEIVVSFVVVGGLPLWVYLAVVAWVAALSVATVHVLAQFTAWLNRTRRRSADRERVEALANAVVEGERRLHLARHAYAAAHEREQSAMGPAEAEQAARVDARAELERAEAAVERRQRELRVEIERLDRLPAEERPAFVDDVADWSADGVLAVLEQRVLPTVDAGDALQVLRGWLTTGESPRRWLAALLALGLFAAGLAVVAAFDQTGLLVPVLLAIAVLGLLNLAVAGATRHFAWYAIAVLVSVPLFGAVLTFARTVREPKVQPAAVVRKSDDRALCGFYVTETDQRVYLARVDLDRRGEPIGGTGRLFWVRSDDVDVLEVGTLLTLANAELAAPGLVDEVYADRAHERPAAPGATKTTIEEELPGGGKRTRVVETEVDPPRTRPRPHLGEPGDCSDGVSDEEV